MVAKGNVIVLSVHAELFKGVSKYFIIAILLWNQGFNTVENGENKFLKSADH